MNHLLTFLIAYMTSLFALIICIPTWGASASIKDTVIVQQDSRMEVLTQKQRIINRKQSMMAGNGLYKGFRIQVISTNKRDDAFRTKAELLSNFPEHKSYIIYQSPNFKVRVGNFIKKEDAELFKAQLNKFYTRGVYIVEDAVEYNPREDELTLKP